MDRDVLMALVADIVLEQGGDWDAVFAILRDQLSAADLEQGELFACAVLLIYEERWRKPNVGAELVREMRDRRRAIVPVRPVRGSWVGWGAAG